VNSKIKLAGLGHFAALGAAASPFVLNNNAVQTAQAADSGDFTPAQKTAMENIIKDYIMSNPQVLMDSVNNYRSAEEKKQEEGAVKALEENRQILLKGNFPEIGNKKGDITIVEFFDYNCGYCKQGYEAVQESLNNDKNIRFVFVEFPILSESSHLAAKYALAAQKQGKYFELHRELMLYKGPKSDESILQLAGKAGLDMDKLKKDVSDPSIEAEIKKNIDLAQKLQISGTPAFIIGDQIIRGYVPYEGMKTMVADLRKNGKAK